MAQPAPIFSAYVGPGHATVTLRGQIGGGAAEEFGEHLKAVLETGARQVTVDANAVTYCDPRVLEFLARTRRRLGGRAGAVTVHGLHPSALPARTPGTLDRGAAPTESPVPTTTPTRGSGPLWPGSPR